MEPEEVICIHKEVLLDLYPELQEVTENSLNFLIEIMIHLSLMLKEQSLLETQEGV